MLAQRTARTEEEGEEQEGADRDKEEEVEQEEEEEEEQGDRGDDFEDPEDLASFEEDLERFAEDSFIQTALSQGVDLHGYSYQIEQELRDVEVESVRDYVSQSEQVVELHNQMQSCDAILARMQEMLLGFQV